MARRTVGMGLGVLAAVSAVHGCKSLQVAHSGDNPRYALIGKHLAVPCEGCHGPGKPGAQSRLCMDCHAAALPSAAHYPGQECGSCHTPLGWDVVDDDGTARQHARPRHRGHRSRAGVGPRSRGTEGALLGLPRRGPADRALLERRHHVPVGLRELPHAPDLVGQSRAPRSSTRARPTNTGPARRTGCGTTKTPSATRRSGSSPATPATRRC